MPCAHSCLRSIVDAVVETPQRSTNDVFFWQGACGGSPPTVLSHNIMTTTLPLTAASLAALNEGAYSSTTHTAPTASKLPPAENDDDALRMLVEQVPCRVPLFFAGAL